MQLNTRELLIRFRGRPTVDLNLDYETLLKRMFGPSLRDGVERGPVPTQRQFINSRAKFKAFKGMAGVAKTTSGVGSILLRALFQPNFKGAIGRFDYNKLLGTTARRFFEMINRINPELIIDRDKTPPMAVYINQPGGIGIAQIDFIGLKEYPGSYEWHRVFVDEADECDENIIEGLKTRLRAPCDPEYLKDYGVDMAFNPPDEVHWIYPACTGLDAQGKKVPGKPTFTLFEPQYGENDNNLPPNYFEDNFAGLPPDMVGRLKYGKWGITFPGKAVFEGSWAPLLHVKDHIPFDLYYPLIVWMDFGFNHPSAHFVQVDDKFRVKVLKEYLGENMEVKPFANALKVIINQQFPTTRGILWIGDPAAKQKKDTGSTLEVLAEEGVELMYLEGMSIEEGLRRVRYVMSQIVGGEAQFQVSRAGCPLTVRMFQGGYHKHKTTGRPVKDGFYDHLADDIRYGITNLFEADGRPAPLPVTDPLLDLQGWSKGAQIPDSIEYDGQ